MKQWKQSFNNEDAPAEYLHLQKFKDCPYICKSIMYFFNTKNFGDFDRPLCLLMPLYPCDLKRRIITSKTKMSLTGKGIIEDEKLIYRWLSEIAEALYQIHLLKIVHRDIKPENIFLDNEEHIKLGDFGVATTKENTGAYLQDLYGTVDYAAPEVWKGHYNEMADMWSLGCVLLDLLSLTLPTDFKISSKEREHEKRISTIPKGYSTSMKKVLKGCVLAKSEN